MTVCIEYEGYKNQDGYGWVTFRGKNMVASRRAWILANGEIPAGMSVLHKCDNRACVNPEHLFLGTQQDNVDDMIAKGRKWVGVSVRKADGLPSRAILSADEIDQIKSMRISGMSQQAIANIIGVSQGCISQLLRGVTKYANRP
jgi:predicted DNA-binding protein (UPF0251 family)